jgi:hypothetical protein
MRIVRVALLAFGLPGALAAQQPSGPPATDPITTAFRTRALAMHRNLAQAFDSIPETKFSYKPTPAQLTIGYVAQHLANDNYFFCNNFGEMKGTRAPEDTSTPDSVKATWPKAKLVAQLKDSFKFCQDAFAQLNDRNLAEAVTLTFAGNTRQSTRANMALGHALDLADHYSQIANYMRLNNLVPPTALPRPRPPGN